jgi:hypothetical protein
MPAPKRSMRVVDLSASKADENASDEVAPLKDDNHDKK